MAKDKKQKKGEALKLKPETHRNKSRVRSKSRSETSELARYWARITDPRLRALSKAILRWGLRPGQSIPSPRIFTSALDKQGTEA